MVVSSWPSLLFVAVPVENPATAKASDMRPAAPLILLALATISVAPSVTKAIVVVVVAATVVVAAGAPVVVGATVTATVLLVVEAESSSPPHALSTRATTVTAERDAAPAPRRR